MWNSLPRPVARLGPNRRSSHVRKCPVGVCRAVRHPAAIFEVEEDLRRVLGQDGGRVPRLLGEGRRRQPRRHRMGRHPVSRVQHESAYRSPTWTLRRSPGLLPADEACVRAVVAKRFCPGWRALRCTRTVKRTPRSSRSGPSSVTCLRSPLAAALARGGARAVRTGAPGAPCAAGAAPRRGRPRRLPDCPPGVAPSGGAAALAHTGGREAIMLWQPVV